jgi:hypothetical protein
VQVSCVQLSPSEQSIGVWTHPGPGSHESIVQMLLSSQLGADPGEHEPLLQVSGTVHALPSLQAVPFGFGVEAEQIPVPGLQIPELLH